MQRNSTKDIKRKQSQTGEEKKKKGSVEQDGIFRSPCSPWDGAGFLQEAHYEESQGCFISLMSLCDEIETLMAIRDLFEQ